MLNISAKDRIIHPYIINHIDRLIAEAACRGETEVSISGNSMIIPSNLLMNLSNHDLMVRFSDEISEYYKSQGYNVDVEYVHLYNEPGIRKSITISWKEE